ncbi:MAG: NAD(P)-dependent oxidoreductase [Myxococcota bacterium]
MSEDNNTTVAVLGLGAMGARIAQRLLDAGWPLVVNNRTKARADALLAAGAEWADSPRMAATQADVVISIVTDSPAAEAVWFDAERGAALGLRPGQIAIEASTLTPAAIASMGSRLAETGAVFLDAPVVGSRPQAEAGKLVSLVGGPEDAVEAARPILSAYSGGVKRCGAVGQGTVMKLMVNALFGIQVAAFSEIFGFAEAHGIDPQTAAAALGGLPITSPALAGVCGLIAQGRYAPMFPIDLVEKDFRYALDAAAEAGAQTPVAAATRRVYANAQREGLGALNVHAVAKRYLKD